jgi:hypothetical protein
MLILSTNVTFAHCDTLDGPLIADARKAMGQNNVNYEGEKESHLAV